MAEAQAYLAKVQAESGGSGQGAVWWLERELEEKKSTCFRLFGLVRHTSLKTTLNFNRVHAKIKGRYLDSLNLYTFTPRKSHLLLYTSLSNIFNSLKKKME